MLAALFALSLAAGCRPQAKAPVHDTFTKVTAASAAAAIRTITYGTTSQAVRLRGDAYGWFQFAGAAGDAIDVWVRAQDGDAVAFVLDGNDDVIAANDDADATTTDAHVQATLPAAGTYYIAFREYGYFPATFTVALDGHAAGCAVDADCAALAQPGDARVAECDNGSHACTLVAPQEVRCGGFHNNAHHCPAGWQCKIAPPGDVPGVCVAAGN